MKKKVFIIFLIGLLLALGAIGNQQLRKITGGSESNIPALENPAMQASPSGKTGIPGLFVPSFSSLEADVHSPTLDETDELEERLVPRESELVTYIEKCLVLESMNGWNIPNPAGIVGLSGERDYLYSLDNESEVFLDGFSPNREISWIYPPSPDNSWLIISEAVGDKFSYWIIGKGGKAHRLETWPADWEYWDWQDSDTLLLQKRDSFSYKLFNPLEYTIQDVSYNDFLPDEESLKYARFTAWPPIISRSPSKEWLLFTNDTRGMLTLWNAKTREKVWIWGTGEFPNVIWLNYETALVLRWASDEELHKVDVYGNRYQITNVTKELSGTSMGWTMSSSPGGRYVATWLVNSGSPYYTFVIIDLEKLIMTNYCIPFEVTSALLWDKEGKNVIFATDFAPEDQTIGRATVLFNLEQDRAFVLAEGVVPRMWWFPE